MAKEHSTHTRRDFIKFAATGLVAATTPEALAASGHDGKPEAGKKLRVALAGLFEEVNTFAVETVITSYSIHYTKLYDLSPSGIRTSWCCACSRRGR